MSQKIKNLLRKAANVVLTPLLDEYFATQDRQNQILLFLKYRGFAKSHFFVRDGVCDDYLPEVGVESCFKSDWNKYSTEERFPLVKDMEWQEV